MMAHLKQKAAELGLPFGDRKKTYNSRLAQELGLWAQSKGQGEAFHMAAFEAYFVDGKNLAQRDVLVDLASSGGAFRLMKRQRCFQVEHLKRPWMPTGPGHGRWELRPYPPLFSIRSAWWVPSPTRCLRK